MRSRRIGVVRAFWLAVFVIIAPLAAKAAGQAATLRLGGTGASLTFMQVEAAAYVETGAAGSVEVIEGLGSSGAIRALIAGDLDIAIAGRALKAREAAAGLISAPLLKTPFGLFTSRTDPISIPRKDVWRLFERPGAPNALFDGLPARVILRPEADSDQAFAKSVFPGFEAAYENARQVSGVPVAQTDQENADLAERLENSITTGTLLQMMGEGRDLRPIAIDGVSPSVDAVASGAYPFFKTLYVVHRPTPSRRVQNFVEYLFSEGGSAAAATLGAFTLR